LFVAEAQVISISWSTDDMSISMPANEPLPLTAEKRDG